MIFVPMVITYFAVLRLYVGFLQITYSLRAVCELTGCIKADVALLWRFHSGNKIHAQAGASRAGQSEAQLRSTKAVLRSRRSTICCSTVGGSSTRSCHGPSPEATSAAVPRCAASSQRSTTTLTPLRTQRRKTVEPPAVRFLELSGSREGGTQEQHSHREVLGRFEECPSSEKSREPPGVRLDWVTWSFIRTRTRTNTDPYGTEVSAAGRSVLVTKGTSVNCMNGKDRPFGQSAHRYCFWFDQDPSALALMGGRGFQRVASLVIGISREFCPV